MTKLPTPSKRAVPGRAKAVVRSVKIRGTRTSIRLEQVFIDALEAYAIDRGMRSNDLIESISNMLDLTGVDSGLTPAIRVFLMSHFLRRHLISKRGQPTSDADDIQAE